MCSATCPRHRFLYLIINRRYTLHYYKMFICKSLFITISENFTKLWYSHFVTNTIFKKFEWSSCWKWSLVLPSNWSRYHFDWSMVGVIISMHNVLQFICATGWIDKHSKVFCIDPLGNICKSSSTSSWTTMLCKAGMYSDKNVIHYYLKWFWFRWLWVFVSGSTFT